MKKARAFILMFLIPILVFAIGPGCSLLRPASPNNNVGQLSQPIKVIVHLDTADQLEAIVPEAGGVINLVTGNGFSYVLTIPAGALISDLDVTMTPIAAFDGLPLSGGLIAGVQLDPEGTLLYNAATLTITPPAGFDVQHLIGFAYHGQGEGFHMAPAEGDGKTISLPITSFSGHGAGSGTSQDKDNILFRSAADQSDEFQSKLADDLSRHLSGDSSDLINLMTDFYSNTVRPALQAAVNDDSQVDAAKFLFLDWAHSITSINLTEQFAKQIEDGGNLLKQALKNQFDKAYIRCLNNQDITEASTMLKAARFLSRMLVTGYGPEDRYEEFKKCLTFELDFDSALVWEVQDSMDISTHVTGNVILTMPQENPLFGVYEGDGTISYDAFSIEFIGNASKLNDMCTIKTGDQNGKLKASSKIIFSNLNTPSVNVMAFVFVDPYPLQQNIPEWDCSQSAGGGVLTATLPTNIPTWYSGFDEVHQDVKNMDFGSFSPAYLFQGFEPGQGGVVARFEQSYEKASGKNTINEDLVLEIVAAPGASK